MHFLHLLFNENNGGNRNGKGKMMITELLLGMAQKSEFDSGLFTHLWESGNKIPTDPKAPKLKFCSVKHIVLANDHSYQRVKIKIILPLLREDLKRPSKVNSESDRASLASPTAQPGAPGFLLHQ